MNQSQDRHRKEFGCYDFSLIFVIICIHNTVIFLIATLQHLLLFQLLYIIIWIWMNHLTYYFSYSDIVAVGMHYSETKSIFATRKSTWIAFSLELLYEKEWLIEKKHL